MVTAGNPILHHVPGRVFWVQAGLGHHPPIPGSVQPPPNRTCAGGAAEAGGCGKSRRVCCWVYKEGCVSFLAQPLGGGVSFILRIPALKTQHWQVGGASREPDSP